jgi:anti-sigma factor (TIGR02949 family)
LTCESLQNALHSYVDGELDPDHHLEIARHLQECSACSLAVNKHQALRKALQDASLYHRAPVDLRERIRSSLPQARKSRPVFRARAWRSVALAASLAFITLLAWSVVRLRSLPSHEDLLAQGVVSSHVRSLMPGHLMDVTSSDQHTVKPWFAGQVDFSFVVKNPADEGYPLAGGRLDYVDNRKVAALVYKRRQHVINVFIWSDTTDTDESTQETTRQGYYLFHWTKAGLTYWVISDLNERELQEFVQLIQR